MIVAYNQTINCIYEISTLMNMFSNTT